MALSGTKKLAYLAVVHKLHDHRFLYKQCQGLAKKGFIVDYYVETDKETVINGVNIKPLKGHNSRVKRFLSTFSLFFKIKGKYSLIVLADPELLPVGIMFKLFKRTKVIFDAHEDYIDFMKHKHYIPKYIRSLVSLCMMFLLHISSIILDGFIFSDEGTAHEMKYLSSNKKMFFYNFPVLSLFPDPIKKWSDRMYDVVFVGSMSRTSGTLVMLNAIAKLSKKHDNLKCLFIGEPGQYMKDDVDRIISENNLKDVVKFAGRLPHGDIPELLQDCKVGLIGLLDLPKFHKNISTKQFEYLASGIPIVSSDLPPERKFLIDGKHCIFIKPGDYEKMSEAIHKIISSEGVGEYMSQECRKHLLESGYYAEKEIEKLAESFGNILNGAF